MKSYFSGKINYENSFAKTTVTNIITHTKTTVTNIIFICNFMNNSYNCLL